MKGCSDIKSEDEFAELRTPVELDDYHDYPRWLHLVFFSAYYFIYCWTWTLENAAEMKIIIDLPLLLVVGFLYRKVLVRDLGVFKQHLKKYLIFTAFWLAIYVCIDGFGSLLNSLIISTPPPNAAAVQPAIDKSVLLTVICIAICAPIMEELMFRRVFRLIFLKHRFLYYLVSSLLFGFAHIVIDFSFPMSFLYIFSFVISGLGLALIYDNSKNVIPPMIVHMALNTVVIIRVISGGITF